MKVHITFHRQVHADQLLREKALARLSQEFGFELSNRERFERYGIATGELGSDRLDQLTALVEVESVEFDTEAGVVSVDFAG
jgi:hypothetical protein